jgi:stage V sporulation protein B
MSFYQPPYPIYNWLLVVSTAGVPAAIAKTISERLAEDDEIGAHKVFRVSLSLMAVIGLASSILMYALAGTIALAVKNPLAVYSIRAIAPAIVFISVMSVFRGYFNGHQDLAPYGISQIFEQLGRVIVGLGLAIVLLDRGEEFSAAGATFGATAGAIVGFLVIFLIYEFKYKRRHLAPGVIPFEERRQIIRRLLVIAVPITLGASIIPIMSIIDLALVMRRLTAIGMVEQANDLYGQLTAYAGALINIPQVVTAGIQISIIPAVSSAYALKNSHELRANIRNGIRTALILGLPSSVGLSVMAREIMYLLYPMQRQVVASASGILQILGIGFVFLSLFQVTSGVLQGMGKQTTPAKNLLVGAVLKVFLVYYLVSIPALNIRGAALSTLITYFIAAVLNLRSLKNTGHLVMEKARYVLAPLGASLIMGIFVKVSYLGLTRVLSEGMATLSAIFGAVMVYLFLLFYFKGISMDELEMIPGGKKIRKLVKRRFNE